MPEKIKGRLPSPSSRRADILRGIEAAIPGIVAKLTEQALAGNVQAAAVLLMHWAGGDLKA